MVVGLFWLIAISALSLNSILDAAPTGKFHNTRYHLNV